MTPDRIICKSCRYLVAVDGARIGDSVEPVYRCTQGVPDGGRRLACRVYEREPGADTYEEVNG